MKPVDIIGAEDMLTSMTNGSTAAVPEVTVPPYKLPSVGADEVSSVNSGPVMHHPETLGEAILDLPNDIPRWIGDAGWFDWLGDLLDSWNITGWVSSLNFFSGGVLSWLMIALVGMRVVQAGKSMGGRGRSPGRTQFYLVPKGAADPVIKFLGSTYPHLDKYLIKQAGGEGTEMVGAPAWGQGDAERGLSALKSKTGLTYRKVN